MMTTTRRRSGRTTPLVLLVAGLFASAPSAGAQDLPRAGSSTDDGCPTGEFVVTGAVGEALDEYLARLSGFGFSGVVLVAERDRILLHRGYGSAGLRPDRPVTTGTVFNIASLTKQFTSAGVLRLVTLGELTTMDSVGRFFSGVPDAQRGVTLHQLLTHTSGWRRDVIREQETLGRDEALNRILTAEPRFAPGERYAYSSAGYQLLAAVIEEITGEEYTGWARRELFGPAQLVQTGFTPVGGGPPACRAIPRNEWREFDPWDEWAEGWRHGSGNIVSTAADLYRWHRTLLSGDLLSPEARASLFRPHVPTDHGTSYAYGWFVGPGRTGGHVVYHGGDNRSYHSEFRWFPDTDRVVIVLTNLSLYDDSGTGLGLHKRVVASALERILDGETPVTPPATRRAEPDELRRLQGTYALAGGGEYTVRLDGGMLKIGADGQDAIDALLGHDGATRARMAAANERASRLLDAMAGRDRDRLESLLSSGEQWIIRHWLEDWEAYAADHGSLRRVEVVGTRPLPWQEGLSRTVARLHFAESAFDFQFTWQNTGLYESLSEVGTPHAVILPLSPLVAGEFATWDLVTARGATVRFSRPTTGAPLELIVRTDEGETRATAR